MTKWVTPEQLSSWFAFHPPSSPEIAAAHELVRAKCGELAAFLNDLLPEGPDKTVALRAVRQVMFEANAVIACSQQANLPARPADLLIGLVATAELEVIKAQPSGGEPT